VVISNPFQYHATAVRTTVKKKGRHLHDVLFIVFLVDALYYLLDTFCERFRLGNVVIGSRRCGRFFNELIDFVNYSDNLLALPLWVL